MAKINSHYIQKALLKEIFPNLEKINILHGSELKVKKFENVASSTSLFSEEFDVQSLEREMNNKLENNVIRILREIASADNEYAISYENAFILRKYFLITFYRLRAKDAGEEEYKHKITSLIEVETASEYGRRFHNNHDRESKFFIKDSIIKIIEHKNIYFLNEDSFFMQMPISVHSDFNWLENIVYGSFPGFIVPISQNRSIIFTNFKLFEDLSKFWIEGKKPPITFFPNNFGRLFIPNADTSLNGDRKSATKIVEDIRDLDDFMKEITLRDQKEAKYIWKVCKMPDSEYESLILYNFLALLNNYSLNENKMLIPSVIDLKKLLEKWLNINDFVNTNSPNDLIYWSSTEDLIHMHYMWEMIDERSQLIIKELIFSLQENLIPLNN